MPSSSSIFYFLSENGCRAVAYSISRLVAPHRARALAYTELLVAREGHCYQPSSVSHPISSCILLREVYVRKGTPQYMVVAPP
ncbi:unnamed protein product [Victoria cruziana]